MNLSSRRRVLQVLDVPDPDSATHEAEDAVILKGPWNVGSVNPVKAFVDALGADFDGIDRRPAGLEDASGYPALLGVLARRGVDQETLGLVAYHNAARAIAEATATAAAR